MLDDLSAFRRARVEFEGRLDSVTSNQRSLPTPCSEWDVDALIQHVIDGDVFAVLILGGSSLHDAITTLMEANGSPSFGEAADATYEAFASATPDQTVDHPGGETSVADFLEFRATDYAGHAWDLARATGQDEALDEELLAWLWQASERHAETFAQSAHFGSGGTRDRGPHTTLQWRWLDRIGRRP